MRAPSFLILDSLCHFSGYRKMNKHILVGNVYSMIFVAVNYFQLHRRLFKRRSN